MSAIISRTVAKYRYFPIYRLNAGTKLSRQTNHDMLEQYDVVGMSDVLGGNSSANDVWRTVTCAAHLS